MSNSSGTTTHLFKKPIFEEEAFVTVCHNQNRHRLLSALEFINMYPCDPLKVIEQDYSDDFGVEKKQQKSHFRRSHCQAAERLKV